MFSHLLAAFNLNANAIKVQTTSPTVPGLELHQQCDDVGNSLYSDQLLQYYDQYDIRFWMKQDVKTIFDMKG